MRKAAGSKASTLKLAKTPAPVKNLTRKPGSEPNKRMTPARFRRSLKSQIRPTF